MASPTAKKGGDPAFASPAADAADTPSAAAADTTATATSTASSAFSLASWIKKCRSSLMLRNVWWAEAHTAQSCRTTNVGATTSTRRPAACAAASWRAASIFADGR